MIVFLRRCAQVSLLVVLASALAACATTQAAPAAEAAPGLRYWLVTRSTPRVLRIHHLRVDLADTRIELAAALARDPDGPGPATAELTPPVELARQARALAMVNANPWQALPDAQGQRSTNWHEGMPVEILGLASAVQDPRAAPADPKHCSLWLDATGRPHIGPPPAGPPVPAGVAGFARLLAAGRILEFPNEQIHPRTAAGLDAAGRFLYLVVVDGRQPGYSEGLSYRELAEYMQELGCVDAVNLDGGGSSIMLLADGHGSYRVLNDPSTKVAGQSVPRPIPVGLVVRSRQRE
jgi:hypothetical protein